LRAPEGEPEWTAERIEQALVEYELEHGRIRTDPAARAPHWTRIERGETVWRVEQTLLDDEEVGDFRIEAQIDLARARETGEVEVIGIAIGRR
jgi:hypothetical protein